MISLVKVIFITVCLSFYCKIILFLCLSLFMFMYCIIYFIFVIFDDFIVKYTVFL